MIRKLNFKTIAAGLLLALAAGCGGGSGGSGAPAGDGGFSGEIVRVGRQNSSGTYDYFREAVLGEGREFKLGSSDQSGSKEVVQVVATTPTAIGYSGMGYATPDVKMLALSKDGNAPVKPTKEAAMDGSYPLARALYLYTVGEPNANIKHFLAWAQSAEGQAIVEEMGYVPIEAVPMTDDAAPPDGDVKMLGSDTLVNVAQRWAEVYTGKYPNVNVQASGGGSGVGINQLIEGTIDIATASREMKDKERGKIAEKGLGDVVETTIGRDALAVYVNKGNPHDTISIKTLAEIFGEDGEITDWSQVGSE
ncbi:MAG: substrate-binding domain-containing protein [Planctomycetales bacterium]|nr:substrate-binding domain-containing protein [Planctomycetales bacterium]